MQSKMRSNQLLALALFVGLLGTVPGSAWAALHSAVLPSEAPHFNGDEGSAQQPVFFATLINDSDQLLQNCRIEMALELPFILDYQVTEPVQNRPAGPANTPAIISPRSAQSFSFSLRLSEDVYVEAQDVGFRFVCDSMVPAPIVEGINTVRLSAGSPPTPELLSAVAVASSDGILQLNAGSNTANGERCELIPFPGAESAPCAVGAYAFALVNTSNESRELSLAETSGMHFTQLCRTDASGSCIDTALPQSPLAVTLDASAAATFSAFVVTLDDFAFHPFAEFQGVGIAVFERNIGGDNEFVLRESLRTNAPPFEWSARIGTVDGIDTLRVAGSLWVSSGCVRGALQPVFDAQIPPDELHLELREVNRFPEQTVACPQAVVKTAVTYLSDISVDGITSVVIRHPVNRIALPIQR